MHKKGFTLIDLLIWIAILGILFVTAAGPVGILVGIPIEYSSGERTGVVVKLSQKGYIWKTWEGEMNLGGMSADAGGVAVPKIWKFSVVDSSIVTQLQEKATKGLRTTIVYKELVKTSFSQGETDYLATGVK
jgi:hypothetical protein